MRKFLISSAVAATVLATSGVARIATDGTGQFLMSPAYFADSGFSTKLKLVNTSLNKSYIYRVTVREYVSSEEFDFLINLSPSDVWDATIYQKDGEYWIKSDDDSNFNTLTGFDVSMTSQYNNNKAPGAKDRTFKRGYVEFYPIAMYREVAEGETSGPVDKKKTLWPRVKALLAGLPLNSTPAIDTTTVGGPHFVETNGSIAGFATVMKDEWKAAMTIPMTAFEDVIATTGQGALSGGNVPNGENAIGISADARPLIYLGAGDMNVPTGQYAVARDLLVKNVTVPFENYGKNDAIYLTFWNDGHGRNTSETSKCYQVRSYSIATRDMKEQQGEDSVSLFSPERNPDRLIRCEMNGLIVSDLLTATSQSDVTKGMAQVYGMLNQHAITSTQSTQRDSHAPSVLPTYMSAVEVNGAPSFSWTYAPTLIDTNWP